MSYATERYQILFDYYKSLPHGISGVPNRKDFHPKNIISILPWMMILKRETVNAPLLITLTGSNIETRMGVFLTGADPTQYYRQDEIEAYRAFHTSILNNVYGGYIHRSMTVNGSKNLDFKSILLPLEGKDGAINRIISAVSVSDPEVELPTQRLHKTSKIKVLRTKELGLFNLKGKLPTKGGSANFLVEYAA